MSKDMKFSDNRVPWATAKVFSAAGKKKENTGREVRENALLKSLFCNTGQQGATGGLKGESIEVRVSQ